MLFRRLVLILIGFAMSFAPLGMPAGAAAPMTGHQHMMAMGGDMDHCAGKTKPDQPKKSVDKSCCAATCVGLALTPSVTVAALGFAPAPLRPAAGPYLNDISTELPTPPPRSA